MLRKRYPWLTEGSLEVLFNNARKEFIRVLDRETGGIASSRIMSRSGDTEGAIRHLREHLEEDPGDPDAWMELGKLLCDVGRTGEGYKAFAEARRCQ